MIKKEIEKEKLEIESVNEDKKLFDVAYVHFHIGSSDEEDAELERKIGCLIELGYEYVCTSHRYHRFNGDLRVYCEVLFFRKKIVVSFHCKDSELDVTERFCPVCVHRCDYPDYDNYNEWRF
jgi:hypothetical protein